MNIPHGIYGSDSNKIQLNKLLVSEEIHKYIYIKKEKLNIAKTQKMEKTIL